MVGRTWRGRDGRGGIGGEVARPFAMLAVMAGLLTAAPHPVAAQILPAPDVTVAGGAFSYDLGVRGSGTAGFGALRFHMPMSRHLVVEPGLGFTRITADSVATGADRQITFVGLEFQAQLRLPLRRFSPYVGVGAGGMVDFRGERGPDEFLVSTYSLAGGVAVDVGHGWALRGEVRGRGIDGTKHSGVEAGVGISRSF